jgi:hypothetical protein
MSLSTDTEAVGIDELFDVLSHPERRRILTELQEREQQPESGLAVETLTPATGTIDVAALRLVHADLPKLDAAGYIDWDRERHLVSRGPRFQDIEPLLELMTAHADELPSNWP